MLSVEPILAYTVSAAFEGTETGLMEQWIDWLKAEHLYEVCEAGAMDAWIVRLDPRPGEPLRCEVRYRFASRRAFEAYERDHAPRLRAEGLARFPVASGIRYSRSLGEIVAGRA
jgi:hypothetical protein